MLAIARLWARCWHCCRMHVYLRTHVAAQCCAWALLCMDYVAVAAETTWPEPLWRRPEARACASCYEKGPGVGLAYTVALVLSARAAAAASMCRRAHLHCLPGWGYDHGRLAALACSGRRVWSHVRAGVGARAFTWRALPRDDDGGSRDRDSQTAVWLACFYRCPGLADLPSALALVAEAPGRSPSYFPFSGASDGGACGE